MNQDDQKNIIAFLRSMIESKNNIIFIEAASKYKSDMLPVKAKSTQRNYKAAIRYFAEYLPANFPLRLIKKEIAQKFIYSYFERGKEQQGFSLHRILKAIFNWFIEVEFISKNPFSFKRPKMKKKLPAYLTEQQFNFLLGFITSSLLRDFYSVLFYTGLRAGELCNLEISNIDLQQRLIRICNSEIFTIKNKSERFVPANDSVFEILKSRVPQVHHLNRKQYIFYRISEDIPLTVDYVSKQFKQAIRKAKLNDNLHLHSLRHSFCSNLVSKNISLYTVQILAGHSSPRTTQIYAHTSDSSLRDAVNSLDNFSINKLG